MTLVSEDHNGVQLRDHCLQFKLALIKNHAMQNTQNKYAIPTYPLLMCVHYALILRYVKLFIDSNEVLRELGTLFLEGVTKSNKIIWTSIQDQ